jgi:hypothetical protein
MPMLTRAYEITDRPGARLYVGIPQGRHRPALWIKTPELGESTFVILAQFHGEKEALVTANFLDTLIGQVQRVIDHLAGEHDNGN